MSTEKPIDTLLDVMAQLRNPDGGCPWDLEQDFSTIAPYTIEEAYEVADAIQQNDMEGLKDELGDLLLQVVFHAQMAKEQGLFSFEDVAQAIADKMIRRHPHVFTDENIETADGVLETWEDIKATEREEKQGDDKGYTPALDGVAKGYPALLRAHKLQKRAAKVGFDWPTVEKVFDKLEEEIAELKAEIQSGDKHAMLDELGDVLFVLANIGRKLKIDPEEALRSTNHKFESRFNMLEAMLYKDGKSPQESSLEEMDALWDQAKENLKQSTKKAS